MFCSAWTMPRQAYCSAVAVSMTMRLWQHSYSKHSLRLGALFGCGAHKEQVTQWESVPCTTNQQTTLDCQGDVLLCADITMTDIVAAWLRDQSARPCGIGSTARSTTKVQIGSQSGWLRHAMAEHAEDHRRRWDHTTALETGRVCS